MSQNRSFCFTTNNYTSGVPFHSSMKYLVFGREVGESGTRHLQGYVVFEKPKRFNEALKCFEDGTHIEPTKGTALQASTYCKKDGDFEEFGNHPQQGKRTDLDSMRDAILNGERNPKRLREAHMAAYKYPHIMQQMLIDYRPIPPSPDILLKEWQEMREENEENEENVKKK